MLITATKQLWQYPSWELHNELTALYIQTLVLTMQQGPYSVYTSIFCLHSPFCNRSGAHWLRTIKELWNCFVLEIIVIVLFTMLYKKRVYSITRTLPPQKKNWSFNLFFKVVLSWQGIWRALNATVLKWNSLIRNWTNL